MSTPRFVAVIWLFVVLICCVLGLWLFIELPKKEHLSRLSNYQIDQILAAHAARLDRLEASTNLLYQWSPYKAHAEAKFSTIDRTNAEQLLPSLFRLMARRVGDVK